MDEALPGRLTAGLTASVTHAVADADTARAVGSGTVDVLATPRLIAWCEQATQAAVVASLAPGETSVGLRVMLDHVAPCPIGRLVTAEATLDRVVGRKLFFTVAARDDRGLVGAGKVTRVIVDQEAFLARSST